MVLVNLYWNISLDFQYESVPMKHALLGIVTINIYRDGQCQLTIDEK